MGCCQGKRISTAIKAAKGYTSLALGKKCKATDRRTRICQQCDSGTWLTIAQYNKWLSGQGLGKVIDKFADLTVMPDLPDGQRGPGCHLFCKLCKCCIPAKTRVADEECPINKW